MEKKHTNTFNKFYNKIKNKYDLNNQNLYIDKNNKLISNHKKSDFLKFHGLVMKAVR